LRRHYALLSDEALVAVDRSELVDVAKQVYDQELSQRRLKPARSAAESAPVSVGEADVSEFDFDRGVKPEWFDEAVCAAVFSGEQGRNAAPDADNARDVLRAAGIPCYLQVQNADLPKDGRQREPRYDFRIWVPGKFNLEAASVLDKEIFNPELEAEYRAHFAQLSDDELRTMKPSVLLAGLADRIERLTRAYQDELDSRKPE